MPVDPAPHLTAREIADLGLPGLPTSRRRVDALATKHNWPFVDRIGRGGGRMFPVSCLPAAAQADLLTRRIERVVAAAPRAGRPAGSGWFDLNPEARDAVEAILSGRRLSAPRILELLEQRFADLPSLRTVKREVARIEAARGPVLDSMRDPDRWKSRHRLALGHADGGVSRAHQVWELDTTKADVMTIGGRVMVLGLIDRWSRRARFLVVPSESGQSVRRLLVTTIAAWGVMPEAVATDNGSGFVNAGLVTALAKLDIEHIRCAPGSPEKKPFVERLFGTFTRERAELLAGYSGHNVADAQALRGRAKKETGRAVIVPEMTGDQLQAVLDAWVDGVYHVREHSTLRMPPMRRWQSSPVPPRAAPSDDVLKIALSELVGTRRVASAASNGDAAATGRPRSPPLSVATSRSGATRTISARCGSSMPTAASSIARSTPSGPASRNRRSPKPRAATKPTS